MPVYGRFEYLRSTGGSVRGMLNDSCANRRREKPSMAIVLLATHDPDY